MKIQLRQWVPITEGCIIKSLITFSMSGSHVQFSVNYLTELMCCRATYKVPDYLPNYWELVARSVQTRTAEECYSYHYSSMRGGGTSGKKKTTKTHGNHGYLTYCGYVVDLCLSTFI